jgi:hypothetical protein
MPGHRAHLLDNSRRIEEVFEGLFGTEMGVERKPEGRDEVQVVDLEAKGIISFVKLNV